MDANIDTDASANAEGNAIAFPLLLYRQAKTDMTWNNNTKNNEFLYTCCTCSVFWEWLTKSGMMTCSSAKI